MVFWIPASGSEGTCEECILVPVCWPVAVHSAQLLLSSFLTCSPDAGFLDLCHCKESWAMAQGARSVSWLPAP